jgi:hypothetical protein
VQTRKKVSRVIVACRVIQPELEALRREKDGVEVRHLDQGLHRVPQKMAPFIQEEIDRVSESAAQIVLGYGLCSNGIVGATAGKQGLIVPRCHDCIAFFLGSHSAYLKVFHARPGTYYLTPGWVAEKKDPLGIVEDDYAPRLGRETAVWAMQEELKHYSHITLINTGIGNLDSLRARAMENARFFKKEYEEIQGSLDYFKKLLRGPYDKKDFLSIEPGQKITQEMFLSETAG